MIQACHLTTDPEVEGNLRSHRATVFIVTWLKLHWRDNSFEAIAGSQEIAHEILDQWGITASNPSVSRRML